MDALHRLGTDQNGTGDVQVLARTMQQLGVTQGDVQLIWSDHVRTHLCYDLFSVTQTQVTKVEPALVLLYTLSTFTERRWISNAFGAADVIQAAPCSHRDLFDRMCNEAQCTPFQDQTVGLRLPGKGGSMSCLQCIGQGRIQCTVCQGKQQLACAHCTGDETETCPECAATGFVQCAPCHGTGYTDCDPCGTTGEMERYEMQYIAFRTRNERAWLQTATPSQQRHRSRIRSKTDLDLPLGIRERVLKSALDHSEVLLLEQEGHRVSPIKYRFASVAKRFGLAAGIAQTLQDDLVALTHKEQNTVAQECAQHGESILYQKHTLSAIPVYHISVESIHQQQEETSVPLHVHMPLMTSSAFGKGSFRVQQRETTGQGDNVRTGGADHQIFQDFWVVGDIKAEPLVFCSRMSKELVTGKLPSKVISRRSSASQSYEESCERHVPVTPQSEVSSVYLSHRDQRSLYDPSPAARSVQSHTSNASIQSALPSHLESQRVHPDDCSLM